MIDPNIKKTLSVCIPTYEMHGLGARFLKHNFEIFLKQTFKDFDIVISDNAKDASIKEICDQYKDKLTIHYYKNQNPVKNMPTNTNNCMEYATGKILRIIFLDDFLYNEKSLEMVVNNFDLETDHWLVTGCKHTEGGKLFADPHYPVYNHDIHLGENTLGSPSVLALKNEGHLSFDPNLQWLIDCDYYKRCYNSFGAPKILSEITTVIRRGKHQFTNTDATDKLRYREYKYILRKHETGFRYYKLKIKSFLGYYLNKIKRCLK